MAGSQSVSVSGNSNIDALLCVDAGDSSIAYRWDTTSLTFSFPDSGWPYVSEQFFDIANATQLAGFAASLLIPGLGPIGAMLAFADDFVISSVALNGFEEFTSAAKGSARFAMEQYAGVSGLTLSEISEGFFDHAEIRFGETGTTQAPAFGIPPLEQVEFLLGDGVLGDTWYSNDGTFDNPVPGNFADWTILHEAGHALGLKHSHEEGLFGGRIPESLEEFLTDVSGPVLDPALDTLEFTIMTYNGTPDTFDHPQSLMMLDIQAIQYLYGADFDTNSGNTTYSWDASTGTMSIDGVAGRTPGDNRVFMTVWDGNGNDTYDLSNYATGVNVNLLPGEWTTTSTAQLAQIDGSPVRGNVANALLFQGDLRSLIENATGGSGNDTLSGNQADNVLTGNGGNDNLSGLTGNDTLAGGSENDTLSGAEGDDLLDGGTGNDSIDGAEGADSVLAGDGNDTVAGGSENDTISAGSGDDSITAGSGNDIVDAGAGADTVDAGIGNDSVSGGSESDSLLGGSGLDTIAGSDGNDTINGGDDADMLAGGSGDDQLLGEIGDDAITGDDGNDTVDGGSGNDTVLAGAGLDSLVGGIGNDDLSGEADSDVIDGGEGDDTLSGGEGNDTVGGGSGSDTITTGDGDDSVTGGTEADIINLGAGNDFAAGESSDDTIDGGEGNNSISGGFGNDVITSGAGIDTIAGGVGSDVIASGGGDDQIDAGDDDDTVTSGSGNDVVLAAGGNDSVLAGAENDSVQGNEGDDIIYGDAGLDVLDGNDGDDTIHGGDDNDTISGGLGNDDLYGEGGVDQLFGNEGNDTLSGGEGPDTLDGGDGIDMASFSDSAGPVVINQQDPSQNTGDALDDVWISIEQFGLSNFDDLYIGFDALTPIDSVFGRDGDDTLLGYAGDDVLHGENGNDSIVGGQGADELNGGAGFDWTSFRESITGIVIDLTDQSRNSGIATGDVITDVEGFEMTDGNDEFVGLIASEFIYGYDGNDTISSGGGNDTIYGGTQHDLLNGGAGDDRIYGENGVDILSGDAGNDLLEGGEGQDNLLGGDDNDTLSGGIENDNLTGGLGDDLLLGGAGKDRFHFHSSGWGVDTINGFEDKNDTIVIEGFAPPHGNPAMGNLHIFQDLGNAVIELVSGGGHQIILAGFDASDLNHQDFMFI